MAARVESPWKRLMPWLVVTVVLAGGGAGGYWWLTHKKDAPPPPPPAGNDHKTPGEVRTDPVAVVNPSRGGASDPVAVVAPSRSGDGQATSPSVKAPPRDSALADEEDAALLPPDALAFASVRVTDLVNSEAAKKILLYLDMMDKGYLPTAEKWLGIPLVQIDRLTFFLPILEQERIRIRPFLESLGKQGDLGRWDDARIERLIAPLAIVRTLTPYDRDSVRKRLVAGGAEKLHNGKMLSVTTSGFDAVHFVSDRLYVRGPTAAVEAFLDLPLQKGDGAARRALSPAERKLGVLFLNTGFYVPALADIASRHAEELPGFLRAHRAELIKILGKSFIDALEPSLVDHARRKPQELVIEVVEQLFDRMLKETRPIDPRMNAAQAAEAAKRHALQYNLATVLGPLTSMRTLVLDADLSSLDLSGVFRLDLTMTFNRERRARTARKVLEAFRLEAHRFWRNGLEIVERMKRSPGQLERFCSSLKAKPDASFVDFIKVGLKFYPLLGEMIEKEVRLDGTGVTCHLGLRTRSENITGLFGAGMVVGVLRVREAAARSQAANSLKQIALAMHIYADTFGTGLPPHAIYDKTGKPLLSWRVAILPFIEQQNLYKQFHLDEPWDSPHNIKLLGKMPRTYAPPGEYKPGSYLTYYQVFTGPDTVFPLGAMFGGTRVPAGFPDGTSNTILAVEAGTPVAWTKPDDIPFALNRPLPKLGGLKFRDGFHAALADGSVHFIRYTISEKTLKAAITRNGGETLGADW